MAGGPKPFGNSRLKFQPLRQSKLEKLEVMSATQQYLLLLGLALGHEARARTFQNQHPEVDLMIPNE